MNPAHRHGLAFDLAALAGAFLLSTLLWSPLFQFAEPLGNTMTPAPVLAWLILAAAVAQFLGSLLKAGPLQARLFPGEKPPGFHFRLLADWKILLLLGGHGFLFPFLLVLAGNSPAAGPLMKPGNFPAPLAWALLICLFLPTLSACAALGLPFPRGGRPASLLVREWAANLLLVFSAVVVQAWFQEAILLPLARQRLLDGDVATLAHPATWGYPLGQLLVLFPLFILCYLPPRLLFFVEDGREGRTWKRILALSFALWTARYFLP